ncbi:MAG: glycosyltransferase [Puniceicoccales bacterium]|nr:glycosyltransferase [Puniceicoccales bacterium]
MNIWIIQAGESISFVDGGSRPFRTEMLTNRLVERGHMVIRWSSNFDHLRKTFRFYDQCEISLGSQLRYIFLQAQTPYRKSISFARSRHNREIANAFHALMTEEMRPNLIVCAIPPLPLARVATEFAHRHNIPIIIDIRDTWPTSFLKNLPMPLCQIAKFFLRNEWRRVQQILHRANGMVALSKDDLKWALAKADRKRRHWDAIFPMAYEEPPQKIFNDKDERLEYLRSIGASEKQSIVTCIGRVGSAFNFQAIVNLAKSYYEDGRNDIYFVLAGEEPIRRFLQKRYRPTPNLNITGWLDQKELNALLAVTTVGMLPYHAIHSPTIRNKPLDFLSMGIPVLSSLGGELAYLIETYSFGCTFPIDNTSALRQILDKLLGDEKMREQMHLNGLKIFHERFSANKIFPAFVDYLEEFYAWWKGGCDWNVENGWN